MDGAARGRADVREQNDPVFGRYWRIDDTSGSGRTSAAVIVRQMTVPTPADCASAQVVIMNFQGHSQDRSGVVQSSDIIADWQAIGVSFSLC